MKTTQTQIKPIQVAIIILAGITAIIHLSLSFPDPMFILNGLGFFALTAALFLPLPFAKDHRSLVRYVFMGYCLLTAALWAAIGLRIPIGYTATTIEIILPILLWIDRK
jgi:hypothetical protein